MTARVIVMLATEARAWEVLDNPPPGTRAVMVNPDDPNPVAHALDLDRCDPAHGWHACPHRGCILR